MRAPALVAALFLAACAGGPKGDAPAIGLARIDGEAIRGAVDLPVSAWAPDVAPAAVIVALHGFGDYGPSTFGRAAERWAARGIATYAYDQRGFGRGPTRGQWPGADALIADARAATDAARAAHPDTPLFLLGHSMGGGVALAAMGEGAGADGLILAAPAVWGGPHLGPQYRLAAWAGGVLFPDKRWSGEGVVSIQASDNIAMLRALGADPVYLRNPSSREFLGLIRIMDRAVAAAPLVNAPALVLWGRKDQVLDLGPIRAAHDALGGPKRMIVYPDGWHLLFRDLQAARVWDDVADWVLSPGGRPGA